MKRLLYLCCLMAASGPALAQTEVELEGVTVEGAQTVQRADGQTIYPTRQQLDHSADGYALLARLTLPDVRVDPAMHTITARTNLGSVQVRINGIVASADDLLTLDMKAVSHIDYVDNPGLRYGEGVAVVIDIIARRATGGYDVGADLTGTLTAVNGDGNVFGKFNHRRSELGVTYGLTYRDFKGSDYTEQATYTLASGATETIHREQLAGRSRHLDHRMQLTYTLSDTAYVFQSRLSASRDIRPRRTWEQMGGTSAYDDHSASRASTPAVDLYWHRDLAHHRSLTANVVATLIETDSHTERNEASAYAYDVRGRTYALWSEALYDVALKPFTLTLGAQYGQRLVDNAYDGDVRADNLMRTSYLYAFGQLKGHLGRLAYVGGMGVSTRYYRQAALSDRFWLLRPKLSVTWPLGSLLKVKYDIELSQHVSQIALVSDVSIKQNRMETLVGNPEIRPNRVTTHDLLFTLSTPRLTSTLHGYGRLNAHCNMEQYARRDGHFYKTQTNGDNQCNFFYVEHYNRWQVIPDRLTATVYGALFRFFNIHSSERHEATLSGPTPSDAGLVTFADGYRHTYTAVNGGASLEAFLGQWTLGAYADNGWHFMEGEHRGHQAAAWYLTASYRLDHVSLALYAQHPFCRRPRTDRTEVISRYVRKEATQHSSDLGNMLTLNVVWHLTSGRRYLDIQRTLDHHDTETGIMQSR